MRSPLLYVFATALISGCTPPAVTPSAPLKLSAVTSAEAGAQQALDTCEFEGEAALAAIIQRDAGRSKALTLHALMTEYGTPGPRTDTLQSAVDDVYAVPQIKPLAYYGYRTLMCLRQLENQPVPVSFELTAPHLLACQSKLSTQSNEQLLLCIKRVIEATSIQ